MNKKQRPTKYQYTCYNPETLEMRGKYFGYFPSQAAKKCANILFKEISDTNNKWFRKRHDDTIEFYLCKPSLKKCTDFVEETDYYHYQAVLKKYNNEIKYHVGDECWIHREKYVEVKRIKKFEASELDINYNVIQNNLDKEYMTVEV